MRHRLDLEGNTMFGLRLPELLLILVVVLVLFGGNKLPALGKGLGESLHSFRKALKEGSQEPSPTETSKDTTSVK